MDPGGNHIGVPRSSDDAGFPRADTNSSKTYSPAWSELGGGVTPELVLVDPELALEQRQTRNRKAAMSSTEPANTFPEPAQPALGSGPSPSPVTSPDRSMADVPLGTLIFRAGLLGEEQLENALQEGMRTGKRLGEVLLERGLLNERDLGQMLAGQKGLPFVDVNLSDVEPEALEALAEDDARRQVALPLFYEDGELVVAVGDPSNEVVLEGLRREIEGRFQLVVAPHSQLQQVIDAAYSRPAPEQAPQAEGVLFPDLVPQAKDEASVELEPVADEEPDRGFASTVQAEAEGDPVGQEKPFGASTPTLLSRMLFPSVRHAAQGAEAVAEEPADEPEQAPDEPATDAPEPVEEPAAEAPAPAEEPVQAEDFAALEVPAVPEMPVPSFEQKPVEAEAPAEDAPEPAAEQPQAEEPQAEEPQPEEPQEEPQPEEPQPEEPQAEEPQPEQPKADEPQAEEPQPEQPQAEEAQPATHFVVVRLRDGESLQIGEHADAAGASAQAAEAVAQIASAAGNSTWPLFSGRYLSPDTIVSVDLVEASTDA